MEENDMDWIPITEQLPEVNENVLFQAESDGHAYVGYMSKYETFKGEVYHTFRCVTARKSSVTGMKPIAWMPLPKRYEKKKKSKE